MLTGQSSPPDNVPEKASRLLGADDANNIKETQGIERQTLKDLAKSVSGISEAGQNPISHGKIQQFDLVNYNTTATFSIHFH